MLSYFLNVWIIGSAAAFIYDTYSKLPAMPVIKTFFSEEQQAAAKEYTKVMPHVFFNPVKMGKMWTREILRRYAYARVKQIWKYLNTIIGLFVAVFVDINLGFFFIAALVVYFLWKRPYENTAKRVHGLKRVDNAALGTSRWSRRGDIKHLCEFGPPKNGEGGIIIGQLEGEIVRIIPGGKLAGHVAVFGSTGSGKSFSFVLPNIIAAAADEQSLICTDPKGELAATTAAWLEKKGYEVRIFNIANPAASHRWNAISECKDDADIAEMAACLVHNTGKDDNTYDHTYFLSKEIQLLEAIVGLLKGDFPEKQQHLRAAMSLLAWPVEDLDARFQAAYQSQKISITTYERWRGVVSANYDHAVSGLLAKLRILTTEPLAALLSEHEINLEEIGTKKTAVFCIMPVSGESKVLKPILSTFYMFLFKRLYSLADKHNGSLPVQVRLLLDEFANIGEIPGFSKIISTARSPGIHVQFILQGRSQLDDVYNPNEAKSILANCPTVLLLGTAPTDRETAEMFSNMLGNAAVESVFEGKKDVTTPKSHHLESRERRLEVVQRSLMEASEIIQMDSLDCIGLIQWCYPLYMKKVGWTYLPQADGIKKAGKLEVSRLVQPRGFDVEIPDIPLRKRKLRFKK
ncbi:type IV secretory system conjugative DNA transfer family protein [Peptococcaceae bacterium]|nr:type IV secretory system conjugative DNA transfer family protein [Peptococcaceae bacterium]